MSSIELSSQSKKILQTVAELVASWEAFVEKDASRDYTDYFKKKYARFIRTTLGQRLFFHVQWHINNKQKYDLNKLHTMLVYRDKINQKKIKSEDASAHFEYSMTKNYMWDKHSTKQKQEITEEYQRRFADADEETSKNLFLDPTVKSPIEVKVDVVDKATDRPDRPDRANCEPPSRM